MGIYVGDGECEGQCVTLKRAEPVAGPDGDLRALRGGSDDEPVDRRPRHCALRARRAPA